MNDLFPVQSTGVGARLKSNGLDFYQTPAWATRALLQKEGIEGLIWEPCCGMGAISSVLNAAGLEVFSSDIEERGYGAKLDFLRERPPIEPDWVITNPPYFCADRCVARALAVTRERQGKVAMLLRLAYLEGQKRNEFFRSSPPARLWVFSRRVNFLTGKSSAMPVAWFVWEHGRNAAPELGWIE